MNCPIIGFKRNKGVLNLGGRTMMIPHNMLALSYLASNRFMEGGDAREDGRVYLFGQPVAKWFTNISINDIGDSLRVWFPKIDNLRELERVWYLTEANKLNYLSGPYKKAFDDIMEVRHAHVKVNHKYEGDGPPWWLYDCSKLGVSFKWCDEEPKHPVNLDVGTKYYESNKRFRQLSARANKALAIFNMALKIKVSKIEPDTEEQMMRVSINGRPYWFKSVGEGIEDRRLVWEKIEVSPTTPMKSVRIM